MSTAKSIQNVTKDVKKWNQAIRDAEALLQKVENRAARLKGAIKTFTELRDCGQAFSGPESVEELARITQSTDQNSAAATQC
jgi:phage shock protein A